MGTLELPVRFHTGRAPRAAVLALPIASTALALLDCDGDCGPAPNAIIAERLAPVLDAARAHGLKVLYFHNAPGGEGGPRNIHRELHGTRQGRERLGPAWAPVRPPYAASIAPRDDEPQFQKADRNGFRDTFADGWLRSWGIETLLIVGFSLRSCVYHTCVGALEHNYRAILLRDCTDPPGTKEFSDTLDPANPEGGWTRFVHLRMIETNEGYTATAGDFLRACTRLDRQIPG